MCLIALNQQSSELDVEALIRGYTFNAHAFGILGQDKITGEAIISKHVGYMPKFLRSEIKRISDKSLTIAVHLRLQTHGKNDLRNCHPYKVQFKDGRRYFVMHNGIFSDYGTKKDSDTMDFIRQIMMPILKSPMSLTKRYIQELLETFCFSNHSKLVIFDERGGDWHIFNSKAGVEDKDIWYSNTGYKAYVYPSCRGYNGNYNKYRDTDSVPPKMLNNWGGVDGYEGDWDDYAPQETDPWVVTPEEADWKNWPQTKSVSKKIKQTEFNSVFEAQDWQKGIHQKTIQA